MRKTDFLFTFLAILLSADYLLTVVGLNSGFQELNRYVLAVNNLIGNWLASLTLLYFIKILALIGLYKLVSSAKLKQVRRSGVSILAVLLIVYALIVLNNAVLLAGAEECHGAAHGAAQIDSLTSFVDEYTASISRNSDTYSYEISSIRVTADVIPAYVKIYGSGAAFDIKVYYSYPTEEGTCSSAISINLPVGFSGNVKNSVGKIIGSFSAYLHPGSSFEIYFQYIEYPSAGETLTLEITSYWLIGQPYCSVSRIELFKRVDWAYPNPNWVHLSDFAFRVSTGGDIGVSGFLVNPTSYVAYYAHVAITNEFTYYTESGIIYVNSTNNGSEAYLKSGDTFYYLPSGFKQFSFPYSTNTIEYYLKDKTTKIYETNLAEILSCIPSGQMEPGVVKLVFIDSQTSALLDNVSFTITGDSFNDTGVFDYYVTYNSSQLTEGNTYSYTASREGYQPVSGSFKYTASGQVIKLYFVPTESLQDELNDPVNDTIVTFLVTDCETEEPITAVVTLNNFAQQTNNNGFTWFEVMKNAAYSYTISAEGYESISGSVSVGTEQVDVQKCLWPKGTIIPTTTTTVAGGSTGGTTTGGNGTVPTFPTSGSDTDLINTLRSWATYIIYFALLITFLNIFGMVRLPGSRRRRR